MNSPEPLHPAHSITAALILGICIPLFGLADKNPPAPATAPINKPIILDKFTVRTVRERIEIYQAKIDNIFDKLRVDRKIRYSTIILNSYDTSKFDLIETLVTKKKFRETTAKGHSFFCNYAAINADLPIHFEMVDEVRRTSQADNGQQGTIYLFKKKKIQIRGDSNRATMTTATICHAAGAALSGFIAPENLGTIKEIGKKKKDAEFVAQVNFEIRLQDLNRYYAVMADGRPIMTPLEAAASIVAMGERLEKSMLVKILERNHITFISDELDKILATPEYIKDGGDIDDLESNVNTFKVAKRLVTGMTERSSDNATLLTEMRETGLRYLTGKAYEDYLERILIEAPGHI